MIERKYALVRVRAGDYLLPSNDARVLWRISSYLEDGSLHEYAPGDRSYAHGRSIRGTFWQCSRWRTGALPTDADVRRDDFLDWENWTTWSTLLPTRRDAIEEALRG